MTALLQEIDDVTVMFKTKRASQQIFLMRLTGVTSMKMVTQMKM